MNPKKIKLLLLFSTILLIALLAFASIQNADKKGFVTKIVDLKSENLRLYWKNDKGELLSSFQNLADFVESKNQKLVFAMNAGMYKSDFSPQGLYIEEKKTLQPLDQSSGDGNFYLKPNGVFYILEDKTAKISVTTDFVDNGQVQYATQSGPMLVINGQIHPAFKQGSANLNIRNGVGILPNNQVVFAMSKSKINFYDFAEYFKNLGCENALYLDGFVSKTYFPEINWVQKGEGFGVMIGITKNN